MSYMTLNLESATPIKPTLPIIRIDNCHAHGAISIAMQERPWDEMDPEERRWQLEWSRRNIED